ncbi:Uncharacterized protein DBV15_06752 [Temnothorax longispinosus]|uniref:Uncharacterized protein n=1 Tax=Temnothorax longispinosus TaxID=300112 RepID=A0A4S2JWA3_9HYME|nr:Uncharacterized protein DBV15_06752 [Temnothorax longispinosus]
MTRVPYGNSIRAVEIYGSLLTNSVNPPTVSFIHNVIRDARDEITSHVITIWPARPLVTISENELNRHLRHLQPWNYTTSLFLALRQLSRAFNTHTRVTDIVATVQYKSDAQYSLADISIIHVHVLEYGGVEIASQLGEEEEDEGDGAGRAVSTASFITNLFHPVVEIVRYALPKRQHRNLHRTIGVSTSVACTITVIRNASRLHRRARRSRWSKVLSERLVVGGWWWSRIKNSRAWGTADDVAHALEANPRVDNSFEWLLTIMGPPPRTK